MCKAELQLSPRHKSSSVDHYRQQPLACMSTLTVGSTRVQQALTHCSSLLRQTPIWLHSLSHLAHSKFLPIPRPLRFRQGQRPRAAITPPGSLNSLGISWIWICDGESVEAVKRETEQRRSSQPSQGRPADAPLCWAAWTRELIILQLTKEQALGISWLGQFPPSFYLPK